MTEISSVKLEEEDMRGGGGGGGGGGTEGTGKGKYTMRRVNRNQTIIETVTTNSTVKESSIVSIVYKNDKPVNCSQKISTNNDVTVDDAVKVFSNSTIEKLNHPK
ncbi:hypothetical protein HELRODRAFT_159378 [Helobdella robusta]|uniref:Uncharacterized protein n=1 Tax=Helobdella robusta TaxID=6412 RepID=T1ENZ2_HELRO|nr:hypothetical protein HELRODRAFT_159378 [Helobdella robusta]ESO12793.1 hypothetical protein HELRODRAFT_159378 [Helobdella robusta]